VVHFVLNSSDLYKSIYFYSGRSSVPERSLVPIRCLDGFLPLDIGHPSDVRDAGRRAQVQLLEHPQSSETAHYDKVPEGLPEVFHAEVEDQPDIQVGTTRNSHRKLCRFIY
jgi:hypothetical protein